MPHGHTIAQAQIERSVNSIPNKVDHKLQKQLSLLSKAGNGDSTFQVQVRKLMTVNNKPRDDQTS